MSIKSINLTDEEQHALLYMSLTPAIMESLSKKVARAQKRITHSSAKAKGAGLQNRVAQDLADLMELKFSNQDDQADIRGREMGQAGVDVVLRGEAYRRWPFDMECKSTEGFSLVGTINQCEADMRKSHRPWMIVHKSKLLKSPIAIVYWDVLLGWLLSIAPHAFRPGAKK